MKCKCGHLFESHDPITYQLNEPIEEDGEVISEIEVPGSCRICKCKNFNWDGVIEEVEG